MLEINSSRSNILNNGRPEEAEFDEDDEEYYRALKNVFVEPRHEEIGEEIKNLPAQNWRSKDKIKTMSVAIVLCLNVGVDPPDIVKPNPCAVMQCWTDPLSGPTKAAEAVAAKLIKQYERWQPKARYRHLVDPTGEEVKKMCGTLRRTSKEERVLFHYNGHGVPKPTVNGEIWLFNRNYTQYIPLSLYDLQQWMGAPSIYVFDCSNAGVIVESFKQFAIQHNKEYEMNMNSSAYLAKDNNVMLDAKLSPPPNYENCILLASCDKDEVLPLHPDLPADLFTSCLTTPIKTFLVWFVKQNSRKLTPNFVLDFDKIPGKTNDRKSVIGELNWIFTAITDTIAWNTLPRELFQRLFRHDLLVASLFRNFLLAQRILRSYDCTPISHPPIKSVHHHPMWNAWDLAVDYCLSQLCQSQETGQSPKPYMNSPFFTEQLTAFQVWLKLGTYPQTTPEQLPIVLQVLLSQVHRSRALDLLGNFLNLGPWAVNLALSVGIFPYVLKLLQASARETRPFLVFIWAKILAVDSSSQNDLIRENAHRYFMNVLHDSNISIDHQVMSAFVLSVIVRHNPDGQNIVVQSGSNNPGGSLIDISLSLLLEHQHEHPNLRKWLVICLGNVWQHNEDVRWLATRNAVYEKLYVLLEDPVPEVRAATVYALGTFINNITHRNEHANEVDQNIVSNLVQQIFYDSSPLVRKELLVTLHWFILIFENKFLPIFRKKAFENHIQQQSNRNSQEHSPQNSYNKASSQQQSIPSIITNSSINDLSNESAIANPRKISRDIMSNLSSNLNKLLNVQSAININSASTANQSTQITPPNTMKRVSSNSSLTGLSTMNKSLSMSLASQTITNIYTKVWYVIELYKMDPCPEVAKMAMAVFQEIQSKAITFKDNNSDSSPSEPASPNNRAPYMYSETLTSENLPDNGKNGWRTVANSSINNKHHSGRVSVSAMSNPYLPHSNNYNSFMTQYSVKRTIFGREDLNDPPYRNGMRGDYCRESTSTTNGSLSEFQTCRKPLISTSFVDWCTKHFARPCPHNDCRCSDIETNNQDFISEWKCKLLRSHYQNSKLELEGYQKPSMQRSIDTKARLLVLHPFEKEAAMATKQWLMSWDYVEGKVRTYDNQSSAKITDIELINTHEKALLMVATEDGSVRVWRDVFAPTFSNLSPDEVTFTSEPKLSTAFYIFEDLPFKMVTKNRIILSWNQRKQTLLAGGKNKFVRLWDACKEMKIRDFVTGSEWATSLSGGGDHLSCVGCADGSVKVFDDRVMANDGRVCSFTSRTSSVMAAKMMDSTNDVITGYQAGEVCWYDRRANRVIRSEAHNQPMTSMTFHHKTDVFACAFGNETTEIQLYTGIGTKGQTIVMRNRTVKYLTFHSLKAKLGIISSDNKATIYKPLLRTSGVSSI